MLNPDRVQEQHSVRVKPANFNKAKMTIIGTAPYVQNKMTRRAFEKMRATQAEGSLSRKRKNRAPKDFDALFQEAIHRSREGWAGIPASSLRNALISACKLVDFAMTRAKLSLFVVADGFDEEDGQPLVKIIGEPRPHEMAVKVGMTTDIAVRPMWEQWSAVVTLRWDADQFNAEDVVNLLSRAGMQVGIGSGRPDSKTSNGMGWGTWEIAE